MTHHHKHATDPRRIRAVGDILARGIPRLDRLATAESSRNPPRHPLISWPNRASLGPARGTRGQRRHDDRDPSAIRRTCQAALYGLILAIALVPRASRAISRS